MQFYAEAARLPNMYEAEVPRGGADAVRCVDKFGGSIIKFESVWRPRNFFVSAKSTVQNPVTAERLVHGWHSLHFPRAGTGARSYALIGTVHYSIHFMNYYDIVLLDYCCTL